MAKTDLDIIKQIENTLSIKLARVSKIESIKQGYTLNQNDQITGLSLYFCEISDLQPIIFFLKELKQLQSLRLDKNQISDISFLKDLPQLHFLYLSFNQIKDISTVKFLTNLTELWMYHNQVKDISPLRELINLQKLQLANNKISDIAPLKQLKNLNLLSLSENQIEELSSWISEVKVGQDAKLTATQEAKLTATQQQTLTQEIKTVQGLFKNLKEDLLDEVEIEIEEEKEQKRIKNELQKTEKAFSELEQAASEGQKQLNPATKNRLEEFIDNLSDEKSRINKATQTCLKWCSESSKTWSDIQ